MRPAGRSRWPSIWSTIELVLEERRAGAALPLGPMAVADFHGGVMAMLAEAGHEVRIHAAPNEVDPAIPFAEDKAPRTYDPDSAAPPARRPARRPTASSACSAPPSSARSARSISSGAASISPSPASPAGRRRSIRAASRICPTRSPARPIATKSPAPASGPAAPAAKAGRSSIPMLIPSPDGFADATVRAGRGALRRRARRIRPGL